MVAVFVCLSKFDTSNNAIRFVIHNTVCHNHFILSLVHCPTPQGCFPYYTQRLGPGTRPKMGHRRMYHATKRAWDQLPEVRKKAEDERKRLRAETNRLRVKLYQKVYSSFLCSYTCLIIFNNI